MHQAIEDIERQLDACVGRVQTLEDHVRDEIQQQREEMHKLRGQLRRALAAVSEAYLAPADEQQQAEEPEQQAEQHHTAPEHDARAVVTLAIPDAAPEVRAEAQEIQAEAQTDEAAEPFADLLSGMEALETPSALVFDEDHDFSDPFASVLPEIQHEVEDAKAQHDEEPAVAEAPPAEPAEAPFAEVEEPAFPQDDAAMPMPVFSEAEPEIAAQEDAAVEPPASDEVERRDPTVADAMSDFIIPADAFTSELEDAFEGAFHNSDPFAEAAPDAEEAEDEQLKPASEFDRLLDWSDFESDPVDESHGDDPMSAPSGDGMTATRAPARPIVGPARSTVGKDRPVTVTRGVAASADAVSPGQKLGDDLTVLTGVDDEMQDALRNVGIISLDEIASWHPADAQRVAAQLGTVSERVIFDTWVPEAQAALFDLFQQRLRSNRFHNLDDM